MHEVGRGTDSGKEWNYASGGAMSCRRTDGALYSTAQHDKNWKYDAWAGNYKAKLANNRRQPVSSTIRYVTESCLSSQMSLSLRCVLVGVFLKYRHRE